MSVPCANAICGWLGMSRIQFQDALVTFLHTDVIVDMRSHRLP